jgi:polar amino acid transport system substrate-binding protein
VLLDVPVATYYGRFDGKLKPACPPIGRGLYSGIVRKGDLARRDALDAAIASMIADGSLRRILEKWGLWNDAQAELVRGRELVDQFTHATAWEIFMAESSAGAAVATAKPAIPDEAAPSLVVRKPDGYGRYFTLLLRGAGITLLISVLSYLVAVLGGLPIALARIYGNVWVRFLAVTYVEIVRGTPLLIQLLVLYFGLPEIGIAIPAFAAGILGLGMNYAAYESEVYRAAILAIPKGQTEAAYSLGMGRVKALRWVILPQAIRVALPPSTNDFIALFKDSSLVSVITVVELTKTFQIHAASTYSYAELGAMTAALYLAMSLPLAWVARRLEERLRLTGAGA